MPTDLYVHGGVYADVDVAPVVGLQAFVQPNDSFVTPGSQSTSWLNPPTPRSGRRWCEP